MALTRLQSDLLLDLIDARKTGDIDKLKFALEEATLHGVPQSNIDEVLAEGVRA